MKTSHLSGSECDGGMSKIWAVWKALCIMVPVLGLVECAGTPKKQNPLPTQGMESMMRSTFGATLKDPVGASRVGALVMSDRVRTLVRGNVPVVGKMKMSERASARAAAGAGAGGEAFEQMLDQKKFPARTAGALQFYVDGRTFFPVYLEAVKGARKSVDVQTFIFDNDDFGVKVADVLRAKSLQVPVRVLYDGLGSKGAATIQAKTQPKGFVPPKDMHAYLMSGSRMECRLTSNAYFLADHSKLHIIDGHTAYMGGMNLGREYRYEWHDLMAKVEGPMVEELKKLYERRWRSDCWWRKLQRDHSRVEATTAGESQHTPQAGEMQQLRLLQTDARRGVRDIFKATLLGIHSAKRRVWIETPYFSNDEVVDELAAALKRGVDVRIVVPAEVDQKIMEKNNAEDLKKLIDAGAKVYAYPGMTHLKATVCDDWATFGSANYDTLSQRVNVEMNLATSDRRTVNALVNRVFQPDFTRARRITPAMAKAKGGMWAEFVGDQL
ncbi:MAG: phosphatidylserine/phosphatidylglycerophosphate/ cardiolipin synthase family protein [Prosthecobacter sp.]|nr:phosphatidylserine/phosphatidylglycerophosphate/ cardiolipin synthase family protein [Prosthecobacter sp.]